MSTVDWTADANDALTLSLGGLSAINLSTPNSALRTVRAGDDRQVLGDEETYEEFHPTFTYPVCCHFAHVYYLLLTFCRFTEKMKRFMATRTW